MDFDLLIDAAWPALESARTGDWKARFSDGVTKRANSVLCTGPAGDIGEVERLYRERGLPAIFQVSDPELDRELADRGYLRADPTLVMRADLTGRHGALPVADQPPPGWTDVWWSVDGRPAADLPAAEKIITGVPAWYCGLADAAVGRGVPQGDTVGIYCMAVLPEARRRGLARRILDGLLGHARDQGLTSAYLAVTARNEAAQRLYAGAGFETVGGYHYRVRA
ncbi:GNAT family N-acetyltransferase [Actinocorallia lasiicapitis]